MECYTFCITSEDSKTPDKAWESFRKCAKKDFKWIRGYKYYRAIPHIKKEVDFDTEETVYRIVSRCFALEERNDAYHEATIDPPYISCHRIDDEDWPVTGFGLAEKKEKV